jgi:adenylate cyclase
MGIKKILRLEQWQGVLVSTPTIAGLVIVLRWLGWLQLLEWNAFDLLMRWRPPESPDPRIVIVTIEESDLRQIGQWPIPDAVLADLLTKIAQQQPRAIGLDMYRDLPVQPGYDRLTEVFRSTPNLIGAEKVSGDLLGDTVKPPPALSETDRVAAVDLVLDGDGKIRRGLMSIKPAQYNRTILSFAARLALISLEKEGITPKILDAQKQQFQVGRAVFSPFRPSDGSYIRPQMGGYQILLNFRGPQERFDTVSMSEVVAGKADRRFGDRIVLIGAIAPSLNDLFYTPYNDTWAAVPKRTPGVVVHANLVSQILSAALDGRPLIQTASEPMEWLWILLWSGVGAILSWRLRPQTLAVKSWPRMELALILVGCVPLGIAYGVLLSGWWIPVVPPIVALMGSSMAMTSYISRWEHRDREMVMSLFERHVSAKIAQTVWLDRYSLLDRGQLVGREMTATVLFSDLKNFSTIAEGMHPATLMSWLNEYMNAMAEVVLECDGVVDKFIGDAVMAVFGVPIPRTRSDEIDGDAVSAVRCAIQMGEKLRSLNQQWQARGYPTVSMRVGIATGTVVAGSLGNAKRLDYTILGDTVNIAARLESYDKSIDGNLCRILIAEETYDRLGGKFPAVSMGQVILKGRHQAIEIYQILCESDGLS